MIKFNIIGALVVGIILLFISNWFVTYQNHKSIFQDFDLFLRVFIFGCAGFAIGGFVGGTFEGYNGSCKKEVEDEDEDENTVDIEEGCCNV